MSDDLFMNIQAKLADTPAGSAFFARERIEDGPWQVSWFIRQAEEWIDGLGPDPAIELRAGLFLEEIADTQVAAVPVLLRVGAGRTACIFATWINPFTTAALELLVSRRRIDIYFYGSHGEPNHSVTVPNPLQPFAARALARVSALSYWSRLHFDDAREKVMRRHGDIESLWNNLAENPCF
jgi:hypothetical protein